MCDYERKYYSYKQELFNISYDLIDLETKIVRSKQSGLMDENIGDELICKIGFIIDEIKKIIPEIEQNNG